MENQKHILVKSVLDSWNSRIKEANGILDSLTDEQLQKEIAPGKNRGTYLLGHLTAVNDKMLPLLDFEDESDNPIHTRDLLIDGLEFFLDVVGNDGKSALVASSLENYRTAGTAAQIPGVTVAGKTGTAQHGDGADPHAWFTAFAPAENPQIAIAVIVLDGGDLGSEATGGQLSAPIAAEVIEAFLNG